MEHCLGLPGLFLLLPRMLGRWCLKPFLGRVGKPAVLRFNDYVVLQNLHASSNDHLYRYARRSCADKTCTGIHCVLDSLSKSHVIRLTFETDCFDANKAMP